MTATVNYRLGSIFDENCDLLVIPTLEDGRVSPVIEIEMRRAEIPFPTQRPWAPFMVAEFTSPRYGLVAFAPPLASYESHSLYRLIEIGKHLGELATTRHLRRISTPLLGTGPGGLLPPLAAAELAAGFVAKAPVQAVLTVSVRDPWIFDGLQWRTRNRVFVSYSHADTEWLERLKKHFRPLEREGVEVWDDTRLKAGEQWRKEIREALAKTKVAILLISADFLASDFITTDELPPLLKAAEEDGATILPVTISHCRFTRMESLSRFQAVNDPAKPLVQMRRANREKVLDDVARAAEDALKV